MVNPFITTFLGGLLGWMTAEFGRTMCCYQAHRTECYAFYGFWTYVLSMAAGVIFLYLVRIIVHIVAQRFTQQIDPLPRIPAPKTMFLIYLCLSAVILATWVSLSLAGNHDHSFSLWRALMPCVFFTIVFLFSYLFNMSFLGDWDDEVPVWARVLQVTVLIAAMAVASWFVPQWLADRSSKSAYSASLMSQQEMLRDIIKQVDGIANSFTKRLLNQGKIELVGEVRPLVLEIQIAGGELLSSVKSSKTVDAAQVAKIQGLVDQVKALLKRPWSPVPLPADQVPQAKVQSGRLTALFDRILESLRSALHSLIPGLSKGQDQ